MQRKFKCFASIYTFLNVKQKYVQVICYNDSLSRFSDIVVYPKSVSFKSLSTLLQDQDSG